MCEASAQKVVWNGRHDVVYTDRSYAYTEIAGFLGRGVKGLGLHTPWSEQDNWWEFRDTVLTLGGTF